MRLMECGWEGRIQQGRFSPSQQACDWLPSVYYLNQKLVGGIPITYKTAAAFNKQNVHPHRTDKRKMSPSNTKRFQKDVLEEITAYLFGLDAARNRDAASTVPGPDDSRSQWRNAELLSSLSWIKPKRHVKVSKGAITSYYIINPRRWDQFCRPDPTEHINGVIHGDWCVYDLMHTGASSHLNMWNYLTFGRPRSSRLSKVCLRQKGRQLGIFNTNVDAADVLLLWQAPLSPPMVMLSPGAALTNSNNLKYSK